MTEKKTVDTPKEAADECVAMLEKMIALVREDPSKRCLALNVTLARLDADGDTILTQHAAAGSSKVMVSNAIGMIKESTDMAAEGHTCKEEKCDIDKHGSGPILSYVIDELLKHLSIEHTEYALQYIKQMRRATKGVIELLKAKLDVESHIPESVREAMKAAGLEMEPDSKLGVIKVTPENADEMVQLMRALANASGNEEMKTMVDELEKTTQEHIEAKPEIPAGTTLAQGTKTKN